jgi:uncharacterized protein (TIGR04255 family)
VQVRFPLIAHLQTLTGIAPLQDRLHDHFPYMQQKEELTVVIGPAGSPPSEAEKALSWQFSDDLGWQLQVGPGVATVLAGPNYEGFEVFADRFRLVLETLGEVEHLRRCDRLGVRYLSVAPLPAGDQDAWTRWFRPELIGWPGSGLLAPSSRLVVSISQSQLASPPVEDFSGMPSDVQGIIRHGVVPAGSAVPGLEAQLDHDSFLMDLDLFVDGAQPFDPSALHGQFRLLHSQIDRFFHWSLTAEGAEHFQLEEVA